ncbi:short chain dehydrogenase [Nemania abortiva]|nr:short chain dehydrogenase [Nemania abortiva]
MQPPYPSLTPTWHNDVYAAIEYTNSKISHNGEVVVITGAGSGIGRETAIAFATAGATELVLVGRESSKLKDTASLISAKTTIITADVTDESSVKKIADAVTTWNVLIHAAGYLSPPAPVAEADIDDYWKSYETNVKSTILLAKHLLPKASPNAAMLSMAAGSIVFPIKMVLGVSAYLISKMALAKTMEFLAHENQNTFFASVHPGMIDTHIFRQSGATPEQLAMDTARLPAGFCLWLTRPEARFLTGRCVWANWDVDELKAMEEEIAAGEKLTFNHIGYPFPHM